MSDHLSSDFVTSILGFCFTSYTCQRKLFCTCGYIFTLWMTTTTHGLWYVMGVRRETLPLPLHFIQDGWCFPRF